MARLSKKQYKELEALETKDTKICSDCKKIKPLFEFGISSTGRKFSNTYCGKCNSKKSKERLMFVDHGITLKEYDKMLKKQDGRCKICKTEIPGGRGRFHIDHDHETSKIRGLLCNNCNHMLGLAEDNIEILATAIQYLIDSRK